MLIVSNSGIKSRLSRIRLQPRQAMALPVIEYLRATNSQDYDESVSGFARTREHNDGWEDEDTPRDFLGLTKKANGSARSPHDSRETSTDGDEHRS